MKLEMARKRKIEEEGGFFVWAVSSCNSFTFGMVYSGLTRNYNKL
jgi:hypothetical protein